jgi:hypothetical protein
MHLFSFYPQASDVGKTHRFAPTTITAILLLEVLQFWTSHFKIRCWCSCSCVNPSPLVRLCFVIRLCPYAYLIPCLPASSPQFPLPIFRKLLNSSHGNCHSFTRLHCFIIIWAGDLIWEQRCSSKAKLCYSSRFVTWYLNRRTTARLIAALPAGRCGRATLFINCFSTVSKQSRTTSLNCIDSVS